MGGENAECPKLKGYKRIETNFLFPDNDSIEW